MTQLVGSDGPVGDAETAWPRISFEARPWLRSGEEVVSRRARQRARGDYRASVPPFIAGSRADLAPDILALADDASQELARFDATSGPIAAPFASILLRTESASSSEIENLTSSAKQVALAELGASRSENAKLVFANVRAMQAALDLARDISASSIISMHQALLEESAPHYVGSFRSEQVWIGGGGVSPHGALFVPPHHERVALLMSDLVAFARRTDIPLLAQSALAHAQFETIHPFPDGNGRTGRALLHSMLRHGGLTRNVTVPVSAGLLRDTGRYFSALTSFREGDIGPIVETVSEAVFAAIGNGRTLVADLQAIADDWNDSIPGRRDSAATALKRLLLRQPVVTAKIVATELNVTEVTAQTAINSLVQYGALQQTNAWKRNRIWHSPRVLEALDSFGDRARRRY